MLVTVPIAGELKFYPFGDDFRVSMGTPAFLFFLLSLQRVSPIISGILTGIAVVIFRLTLGGFTEEAWSLHSPVFFYYLTYGGMFALLHVNRFYKRPLLLGFLAVIAEIAASIMEISARGPMPLSTLDDIAILAVIRSFFVLGFFNILIYREQRKRNEQMLVLISNLYEEMVHLKKTMQQAETITKDAYDLYRNLKPAEFAQTALRIAGQVHEMKKDKQRIYAGLSKMICNESIQDFMSVEELGKIVVRINQKYADLLKKKITFHLKIEGMHPHYHVYTALSLLNNLAANAVEAIQDAGVIDIFIRREKDDVEFRVADDGPGIPEKKRDLIFQPGFTTKYDFSGKPSTGIGLTYVRDVTESAGGRIRLEDTGGTAFIICLPINHLIKEGWEHAILSR